MSLKRGATGLSGILLVDKPAGLTSHDVVNAVRRATGERRVGHAGTLDPLATGLLVVLVGPAARLAPWLTAAEKTYEARIVFGAETDTDDAEGTVVSSADVPADVLDTEHASRIVAALVGKHLQTPPAYSAIKVGGRTAHRVARAGGAIDIRPREVEVHDARLVGVDPGPPASWDVEVAVSKGTYVRALARDLGRSMSSAAHLGALHRTRSGALDVRDAVTLADMEAAGAAVAEHFVRAAGAIGLPVASVDDLTAVLVSRGASLPRDNVPGVPDGSAVAIVHDARLVAVYEVDGRLLRPAIVLPGGAA